MPPESARGSAAVNDGQADQLERVGHARVRRRARGTPARSSGRRTLVSTLAQGINVGDWKTKASFCCCGRRRQRDGLAPHQEAPVARFGSKPAIIFRSVLLPQPDGPSKRDELALLDGQVDRLQGLRAVRDRSSAPTAPRWPGSTARPRRRARVG